MKNNIDYGIKRYIETKNYKSNNKVYRVINKNINTIYVSNEEDKNIIVEINNLDFNVVVGDYVELMIFENRYYILKVLDRISTISKASNRTKKSYAYNDNEQILATNVEQIFILIAADQRFTLSKLERYLMTFGAMVSDVNIIISKSDYDDLAKKIKEEILSVYPEINVSFCSIYDEVLISEIMNLFKPYQTAILLGSSGAGKSTLLNYMLGEELNETQDVRSDGKGKHTTTSSTLLYIERTKSYIIDTPGFKTINTNRELNEEILFSEILELSKKCKFNDCKHESEPGCAVKKAIKEGKILKEMYDRYLTIKDKNERFNRFLQKKSYINKK